MTNVRKNKRKPKTATAYNLCCLHHVCFDKFPLMSVGKQGLCYIYLSYLSA